MVKRPLELSPPELPFGASTGGKKKRKVQRRETPLQKFRKQTIAKRAELKKTRKECDIQLRQIQRDLGILKRK